MKKQLTLTAFLLSLLFTVPVNAQEANRDLSMQDGSIRVDQNILISENVRIYATVQNNSGQDLRGTVRFFDETVGDFIDTDQPVSIVGGGTDDVFVDWQWEELGDKVVTARVVPWEDDGDDPNNNKTHSTFYVDRDSDQDGIPDGQDPDDDNDGVNDGEDLFPLDPTESADWDGDDIGDNADEDDDNDGVPDVEDVFTRDPAESKDSDGDGVGDNADQFPDDFKESVDADGDGIGANADVNDNNQGPIPAIRITNSKGDEPELVVGQAVVFNGLESNDPDGEVLRYEWVFDDEVMLEGGVPERIFEIPGEYIVTLTVFDDKEESRSATKLVTISEKRGMLLYALGVIFLLALIGGLTIFFKKNVKKKGRRIKV